MRPDLQTYMVQSHIDDLHREAAVRARRGEARRVASDARRTLRPELKPILQPSMFRRLVTRFAL